MSEINKQNLKLKKRDFMNMHSVTINSPTTVFILITLKAQRDKCLQLTKLSHSDLK